MSGSSQGSALIIDIVLSNRIPCKGFILAAPYMPEKPNKYVEKGLNGLIPLIPSTVERGIKGVIVIGKQDPSYKDIIKFHTELVNAGMECKLIEVDNADHGRTMYKFKETYFKEALDFFNN